MQSFQTYFQRRVEELLSSAAAHTAFFFRGLLPEQLQYLIGHPSSLLPCDSLLSNGALDLAALEENRRARAFYEKVDFRLYGKCRTDVIGGKAVRELAYCRHIP